MRILVHPSNSGHSRYVGVRNYFVGFRYEFFCLYHTVPFRPSVHVTRNGQTEVFKIHHKSKEILSASSASQNFKISEHLVEIIQYWNRGLAEVRVPVYVRS